MRRFTIDLDIPGILDYDRPMKSLIIIEVEHGEDTDSLMLALSNAIHVAAQPVLHKDGIRVTDWTVRVDLPACFVLDSGS